MTNLRINWKNTPSAWLVNRMQALGYKSEEEGICFGVALMAMHAILANNLDRFNRRLEVIASIPLEEFRKKIEEAQAAQLARHKASNKSHRLQDELILEIPAFFDGLELYQNSRDYPHILENKIRDQSNNIKHVYRLISPDKLEYKKIETTTFSGVYNLNNLIIYLDALKKLIIHFDHPLALTLSSADHSITVGYNPAGQTWSFINSNSPPSLYFPLQDTSLVAKKIMKAFYFATTSFVALETNVYADELDMKIFFGLNNNPAWKKIHNPNDPSFTVKQLTAWLGIATYINNINLIKLLLKNRADVNAAIVPSVGSTPLSFAVEYGHLEVVEILLNHGANPNIAYKNDPQVTPLYFAIHNDFYEIVKCLINNGADPNIACRNGITSLHLAINYEKYTLIKLLLESGANSNLIYENKTPLFCAVENRNLEIIKLLLEQSTIKIDQPSEINIFNLYNLAKTDEEKLSVIIFMGENFTQKNILMTPTKLANLLNLQNISDLLLAHSRQQTSTISRNKLLFHSSLDIEKLDQKRKKSSPEITSTKKQHK